MVNKSKAYILTRSFLLKHYIKQNKSSYDIAKEFNVGASTVSKYLKIHSIESHSVTGKAHDRVRELSRLGLTKKRPQMSGENNPAKRLEVRIKISKAKQGKNNAMYGRRGKLSPRYKHGNSKIEKLEWGRFEWKDWRKKVFERDNYTCQKCGDNRGGNLEAHHIKPRHLYPKLKYNLENGITLCRFCHRGICGKENIFELELEKLLPRPDLE